MQPFDSELQGTKAKIAISRVDEKHNNAVMNPPCMELSVTETREVSIVDGKAQVSMQLPRCGFACWNIEVE